MRKRERNKWVGLLFATVLITMSFSVPFQQFASFPQEIRLFKGSIEDVSDAVPSITNITSNNPEVVTVNHSTPVTINPIQTGKAELQVKLGAIPLKTVRVNVMPDFKLIPGGQSIGVKLQSAGIIVVGHHLVQSSDEKQSPGEMADVRVGDVIIKINDKSIHNIKEVAELVNEAGRKKQVMNLKINRGKSELNIKMKPALDSKENVYRMGLYIRDSAAGVGTLTFFDPKHRVYGALGHIISDTDTGQPITVGGGEIVHSNVTSIDKGENGDPGQKRAIFSNHSATIGSISKNTPFGIFGKMPKVPENGLIKDALQIGLSEQVKEGPAEILTVVEGQKVEKFHIEIKNVIKQRYPATKGMIIKVTDPRLLEKTGGIVQGMSGSPIIQNNRIIGAVTHVFVNDPTSGYGCFIEWMLRDAGIDIKGREWTKNGLQGSPLFFLY